MTVMKLYWTPRTRSMRALWLLEEAGCAYERILVDLSTGAQSAPDYRRINPMAKVPALVDGDAVVAESAAICAYVADLFPEAGLAPPVGDPARGRYLQWLFFSAGCVDPAFSERMNGWTTDSAATGWGSFDRVFAVLEEALDGVKARGGWILGERFSAADVLLGIDLHYGKDIIGLVPRRPAFEDYVARCLDRPAFQRALAIDAAGA